MGMIDLDTREGRLQALETMLLLREFEERVGEQFADNKLPGFVHLYAGQEAVAVGACATLDSDDQITSNHRAHGHALAKGVSPDEMMAELYGKAEGVSGGKGGSMHIADTDVGFLGANAIVGSNVPLATGAALTNSYRGTDQVSVAFFGDGAFAQGQVHESINLAAVWDLPIVYLLENNQYSAMTHIDDQVNIEHLSEMAGTYGIPGHTIDGMDVMDVYETVSEAVDRARNDSGPTIIEAETYRYGGHHYGDTEEYREDSEVHEWQEQDPILRFKRTLVGEDLTEAEFEDMEEEVTQTVQDAIDFSEDGTTPDIQNAYETVFTDQVPDIERFRTLLDPSASDQGGA